MKEKTYQLMNWPQIEAIVYAEEDHPERILGAHPAGNGMLYQAFFPGAQKMTLVLEEKAKRHVMEVADEEGFFAVLITDKKKQPYHYEVKDRQGEVRQVKDPYAFKCKIDREDLLLYRNGIHYELDRFLGCRKAAVDGVEGLHFTMHGPEARRVSVIGEFNGFDGRAHPMYRVDNSDIFTLFVPGLSEDTVYQYEVLGSTGRVEVMADPFGVPVRREAEMYSTPFGEAGVFPKEGEGKRKEKGKQELFLYPLQEEEMADRDSLIKRIREMEYTHAVLPLQKAASCFYEAVSGFGQRVNLKEWVEKLHLAGIGVLLNWDVSSLKELWVKENSNFHIANVLYLTKRYHLDGVVLSGLAALLYLDYGKEEGQWIPNLYGGNENLDAVEWIKHTNSILKKRDPRCLLIADLDAIWPDVTLPLEEDGLGFDYRYDHSFGKEYLTYIKSDPYFRSGIHENITNRMLYAYRERFIMPFRDPEIESLWEGIHGEEEDRFRTMKLAHAYLMLLPGKVQTSLRLPDPYRGYYEKLVKNSVIMDQKLDSLGAEDERWENFKWINCFQYNECVVSFCREAREGKGLVLAVANFANTKREGFRIGVPYEGKYRCFFDTESVDYGGNRPEQEPIISEEVVWDGYSNSICLDLEALSLTAFVFVPFTEKELFEIAEKKAEEIRRRLEEEARNKAKLLKKTSLKDTLSRQVEQAQRAINEGSEGKIKMEHKRRTNGRT